MTWDDLTFIKYKQCIQPSSYFSYFLASRWFFQSLRLMKAAEPSALAQRKKQRDYFSQPSNLPCPKDLSIFSGAEKRTKRDIHPPQGPSHIWRGCN